jgi:hypothetical protein
MSAALRDSELAALASYLPRVVGGDGAAWREVVTRLEPLLIELASQQDARAHATTWTIVVP